MFEAYIDKSLAVIETLKYKDKKEERRIRQMPNNGEKLIALERYITKQDEVKWGEADMKLKSIKSHLFV